MEMKKYYSISLKATIVIAIFLSLVSWQNTASIVEAEESSITAAIDDKKIEFNTPPYQKQGTTLVPFRAIFEALNLKVGWDSATQQVTGTSDSLNVTLTINSKNAYVNGNRVVLSQAPEVVNGATMIPLRFVAEASGGQVYWDSKKRHIDIVFNERLKLFKSSYYNDSKSLKHWLDNGYSVEEKYNGLTPLLYAAMGNAWDTLNLLLKNNANPDVKSASNWTPLLWAAYHQNDDMVKRLLEYGASERFVTDSSTYDLKLAQTRLANYLNNGSTKRSEKRQINDPYFVAPLGSTKAKIKSLVKTTLVKEESNSLLFNKVFTNGDIGFQYYTFENGKLVDVAHLLNFDSYDAYSAIDEFFAQLTRIDNVYGTDLKYTEVYATTSDQRTYESIYSNMYERYEMAIWLGDLQLFSRYEADGYRISVLLNFDDDSYTYSVFVMYDAID